MKHLILFALLIPFLTRTAGHHTRNNNREYVPVYQAFKPGEELKFRIHYGSITAGVGTLKVDEDLKMIAGRPHYQYSLIGRTISDWEWFYKVRDYYYSYTDTATLLPSVFYRDVSEGSYTTKEKILFKRAKKQIVRNDTPGTMENPLVHDMMSPFYYCRNLDLTGTEPGTEIPFDVFFDGETFSLGFIYDGKTTIETEIGKFNVLIIRPQLVKGRVFKGQQDMTVYISDDKNHVPLRIQSEIFVGSVKIDLVEYKNLKYPLDCRID